jgi:hypothetical protein
MKVYICILKRASIPLAPCIYCILIVTFSVSDLYSFDTDPDSAFLAEYRSGSNPDQSKENDYSVESG